MCSDGSTGASTRATRSGPRADTTRPGNRPAERSEICSERGSAGRLDLFSARDCKRLQPADADTSRRGLTMRSKARVLAAVAWGVPVALWLGSSPAQPPGTPLPEGIRGGSEVVPGAAGPNPHLLFEPTDEELPYSVFVSSKVKPGEKAPLIIALRGLHRDHAHVRARHGGRPRRGRRLHPRRPDRLQQPRGLRRGAPRPAPAPGSTPGPARRAGGRAARAPVRRRHGGNRSRTVTEYSEKDVMNVLAMVRKEFNVDDRRIYLMGHSQGGGGALTLTEKYPDDLGRRRAARAGALRRRAGCPFENSRRAGARQRR